MKRIAAHKKASGKDASSKPESKQQKLIEWAERHGMPKKLAENPKDKQKVLLCALSTQARARKCPPPHTH